MRCPRFKEQFAPDSGESFPLNQSHPYLRQQAKARIRQYLYSMDAKGRPTVKAFVDQSGATHDHWLFGIKELPVDNIFVRPDFQRSERAQNATQLSNFTSTTDRRLKA